MSIHSLGILAGVSLLFTAAGPALAADPAEAKPLVTKVFNVADLVVPSEKLVVVARVNPSVRHNAERLIRIATVLVSPKSWVDRGGNGTAEYFDIGGALVVTNTEQVVTDVGKLLVWMQKFRDALCAHDPLAIARASGKPSPRIQMELIVARVPRGFLEDAGLTDDTDKPGVLTLTPRETNVLSQVIRNGKVRGVLDILSRPQVVVSDNQSGTLKVGDSQSVVTALEITATGTGTVISEKKETREFGLSVCVTPRLVPDSTSVQLRVEATWTSFGRALAPVTLPPLVTGLKFPVTYFLAAKSDDPQTLEKSVLVAEGRTVVLRGLQYVTGTDGPFTAIAKRAIWADEGELILILTPHRIPTTDPGK